MDDAAQRSLGYHLIVQRSQQRLAALAVGLLLFLLLAALVYQAGMRHLEQKPRTFLQAFEWASETLSTTGYGSDNRWGHPLMVMLVVTVQLAGIILVPLVISIYLLPFLAERFEQKIPRTAPDDLESHVIVYRYGSPVETLLRRLQQHGIRTLVAETNEEQARAALDRQQTVVFSRSDEDILDACRLDRARALVMNAPDEENAGAILRARQMGFRGEIYAFVAEPSHRMPMELAGATAAYTPRHIIAAALAAHASETISPRLPGFEMLGGRLQRREMRVPKGSPMVGRTLSAAGVGAATEAIVVGQWSRSRLNSRCTGEMKIDASAILEIVGDEEALEKARELIGGSYLRRDGPFLIAGFGEVGRKVHELLSDAGEEVRVIERRPAPGVDVVGDVLDVAVLERAGLRNARAVILALDSDDSTLFATVIVRDAVADVAVIARVNHERNVDNIHRAGADFALSVADISGEMLSARLLGRSSRDRDDHRRVMPLAAKGWAGIPLHRIPLRASSCSALAIERNGTTIPIHRDAILEPNDRLWICGTREGVAKLAERQ